MERSGADSEKLALEQRLAQRTKELSCLYALSHLVDDKTCPEDLLEQAVALLPPALLYPEDAVARIVLHGRTFGDPRCDGLPSSLREEIGSTAKPAFVEIGYRADHDFQPEERELFAAFCRRIRRALARFESEQSLRLSEQRYRLLADNTLDVIWAVNQDRVFTYVNPAVTSVTGFTPEELVGIRLEDHCKAEQLPEIEALIEEALSQGLSHQGTRGEFEVLHRDGYYVPVEIHARLLYSDDGIPVGIQGTSRDVRERRATLAALRESEQRYRIMFETMAQGALFLDEDGDIVSVNPAAERILGLPADKIIGRSCWHPKWRTIREDGSDFPSEEHPAVVALRTGREIRDVLMGVHNPIEDSYRWIQISASPDFREDISAPYRIYCTFQDVTELRQAQAEREAAYRFNSELLESIEDCFFALDSKLFITYVNQPAEKTLGRQREDVVGRHVYDAFPEGLHSLFAQKAEEAVRESKAVDFETFFEPHNCWYEVRIYPREWGGISIFFACIDDRKRSEEDHRTMERQLQRAQKLEAVGRLAGGVAHDFNNMLSVILGNVELARQLYDVDHPASQLLDEIETAAQRSATLTRQLLTFARKQTISPQVLCLNETVENTLTMLKRLVGENISLKWTPGAELPPVRIDPGQLDEVITHLVVNARDAIEGVGTISISTTTCRATPDDSKTSVDLKPGLYVVATVEDTGSGIPSQDIERLFEPFFTTKPEGHGTGLGLPTVHGIVQQNGGAIEVQSQPGQGATFRMYLPASQTEPTPAAEPGRAENKADGGLTVLLVEDEPSLLKLTQRSLKALGYEVHSASSPLEALQICRDRGSGFDLLLTDVVMPEMNGWQLYQALLQLQPNLKCLFMSGYTSDALANHAGELDDGVHFLQKPFTRQELAAGIRGALE